MGQVLSHYELAKILGISRTRVWQIEKRALAKLRKAMLEEADLAGVSIEELFFAGHDDSHDRASRQIRAEAQRAVG